MDALSRALDAELYQLALGDPQLVSETIEAIGSNELAKSPSLLIFKNMRLSVTSKVGASSFTYHGALFGGCK